ncbi:carbohydrate esterase family 16 protein [Piromyces sp. E2]|nr:carbohydrate esterase family 16 protein [Piromyces sp. E2]|eukprot:OUM57468.1 carbohydrate esterase family 16 protein [Piromyces sp. E2]
MTNWNGNSTLFIFWFGINDIVTTNTTYENTIDIGLTNAYNTIFDLYKRGAQNFLLINVPPFNDSPWGKMINETSYYEFTNFFNIGYQNLVSQLSKNFPNTNIFLYNAMDEFNYLLENHNSVGINDIDGTAIDNEESNNVSIVEQYFWYNVLHPSTSVHRCLATDIHQFLNKCSVNKVQPSTTHEKALANFDIENSFYSVDYMTKPSEFLQPKLNTTENQIPKQNIESGSTLKFSNSINSSYFALTIFLFYFLFF